MAENIDATTDGSGPYNTSIPELVENANIQEALRIYHYGSKIPPLNMSAVLPSSIAGHLRTMSTRVSNLEIQGIGSSYLSSEPSSIPNGYIWVDADSAAPIFDETVVSVPSVIKYQNNAPTENLRDGMQWVDKDDPFLTMYIYDQGAASWIRSNQIARYQDSPPTGNIVEGSLWVDRDSVPLMMYVFDSIVGWRPLGV
jgi:hypothetical protein